MPASAKELQSDQATNSGPTAGSLPTRQQALSLSNHCVTHLETDCPDSQIYKTSISNMTTAIMLASTPQQPHHTHTPSSTPSTPSTSPKLATLHDLYPSYSNTPTKMSGSSGSSSRDWNDVLKHGSALGILKPDVAFPPYGGSSTSGGSSGTSGGTSGGSSSSASHPAGGVSRLIERLHCCKNGR